MKLADVKNVYQFTILNAGLHFRYSNQFLF